MSKNFSTGSAAIAGAIGSAAIAAALLYASKRKERREQSSPVERIPSGENPETD